MTVPKLISATGTFLVLLDFPFFELLAFYIKVKKRKAGATDTKTLRLVSVAPVVDTKTLRLVLVAGVVDIKTLRLVLVAGVVGSKTLRLE